jgi:hypothetical protein
MPKHRACVVSSALEGPAAPGSSTSRHDAMQAAVKPCCAQGLEPLAPCIIKIYNNYSLSSNGFCPTVVVVSPVVKAPKLRVVTRLIS